MARSRFTGRAAVGCVRSARGWFRAHDVHEPRLTHTRTAGECGESGGLRRARPQVEAQGTRLPAGVSLTSCLPGLCFTSSLPGLCFTSCLPGSASPPASRGRRLDGADRQPIASRLPDQPLHATEPAKRAHSCQRGTSCRSEKNPPLTHGDPAEAGPPGQSQPSRVHPVKQQAGAMRTRTGARPSSSSCATPVAWTYEQLRNAPGGGRHPQTRPTGPPPCGIAREKPPKWRTATPPRIPPLPPPARLLSCPPVHSL
jgi:hypothetical protein